MITGIDHVHVTAVDMDKSIAFYTEVLGFHFLRRVEHGPADARRELAYVGLGDTLIEFLPPAPGVDVIGTATRPLALTVTDLEGTLADLVAKGVEVTMPLRAGFSYYGLAAAIKDPSGLTIELREWNNGDGPQFPDWQPEREDVVRTA